MVSYILTVSSGVLIYVLGQFILKMVIEPVQELQKAIALTSNTLLLNQARLTNARCDKDIANEIQFHSADIVSKASVVMGYNSVQKFFGLPSKKNVLAAARELNCIYYGMIPEAREFEDSSSYNAPKTNFAFENSQAIDEIAKLLNTKTTYQEV